MYSLHEFAFFANEGGAYVAVARYSVDDHVPSFPIINVSIAFPPERIIASEGRDEFPFGDDLGAGVGLKPGGADPRTA